MREDVLPETEQYSFVEITKGEPPEDAATKLYEFSDWDDVDIPPDGPLEFYVVYDADGNEVPEGGPEGDNPGGNAPETGKQEGYETTLYKVIGHDDMDGQMIGVAVDFPNDDLYVDWKNDEWPEGEQLDDTHVSIYGSQSDFTQATGNELVEVETVGLDDLEQKMVELKASVPDAAVNVQDESEIPDDAQSYTGPRGGLYYVDLGGTDRDELADAIMDAAEGTPAEKPANLVAMNSVDVEDMVDAMESMPTELQNEIFDRVGAEDAVEEAGRELEAGQTLDPSNWDQLQDGDMVEAEMEGFAPVRGEIVDTNPSLGPMADGDQGLRVEGENGTMYDIGSDSHGELTVTDPVDTDDSETFGTEPNWDEVHEDVPRRPEEAEEAWEEAQADNIIEEASQHDMTPEEYREAVAEEYSRVIENSDPAIRVSPGVLGQILDDGRFKNQHETGSSSGWLDEELRENFESDYMGVDPDTPDSERPIYGYLTDGDSDYYDDPDDVDGYGNAAVQLSDSAKERATVTHGDSLSANQGWVKGDRDMNFTSSPATDPDEKSMGFDQLPMGADGDTHLEMLENADNATDIPMYNEMQYHGGVSADEIESVTFGVEADFLDPPDQEMLDRLEERGIEYEVKS